MANYMSGTSYEAAGDNLLAGDRFKKALAVDPYGIDSALALLRVSKKTSDNSGESFALECIQQQRTC